MRKRYILVVSILTGILLTLAVWGAVEGIICNSGTLISQCGSWLHNSDIEQYAEIFTQLKDAQIQIPAEQFQSAQIFLCTLKQSLCMRQFPHFGHGFASPCH